MEPLFKGGDTLKDTGVAFLPCLANSVTSGSLGEKEKEATPQAGTTMSAIGKWLAGVKSFEITGKRLVLVVAILSAIAGLLAGIKFDRSRNDVIYLGGKSYMIVGLAEVPGNKNVYLPVYKDMEVIKKGG